MTEERCYRVLTAVGADRPGLVERISGMIHLAGANVEDSRMAILGGEFALILLLSGGPQAVAQVEGQQEGLRQELGLSVSLRQTAVPSGRADYLPYLLSVSGVDRPGIVARVSSLLARVQINVAALDSRLGYAPLSGTPLFYLSARIHIPSELALPRLRTDLGQLCEAENLDFTLEGDAVG